MAKRMLGWTLIVALMFSTVLAGCSPSDKNQTGKAQKEELVLAIGGEPKDGFDPTTGWGRNGSPLFQSTLFKYDHNFNVVNDLAEHYEISDDGLTWTVKIREDARFSDGKNVTADDVAFTYNKAKTSGSVMDLTNLDNAEKTGPYTVEFKLKKPQSNFIYLLITTGIVPQHAYDDNYKEQPIGSGPYKFVQWNKGQQLIVEANPHYYEKKPFFKKITFLFLSEDAAFAAAKAGQADIVSVPASFAKEKIAGMKLVTIESVDNRGIMFPTVPAGQKTEEGIPVGNDVTSDVAIRKAINIGIDRQALVDGVLEGFGTPAYSVADKLPWWNADTAIQDKNIEQARKILDQAGWKENASGIREKNGLEAAFTLYYPSDDQIRQSLSITVAEMIKPLGIKVKTEGKSWNELERLMFSNPVMMGWGNHDPIEMYNLHSSKTKGEGYYNPNFYSNPKVDQYMEQALRASSTEEAYKYWKMAQWDGKTGFSAKGDAPWAWLVNVQHLYYVRDNLDIGKQKIHPHGHAWPITDTITDWKWK